MRKHRRRIWFLMFLFVLPYGAVAARLVMFQVDPNLHFNDEELFHIREVFIDRPRGQIFDTRGRVLATNREVPSLSANPSAVKDPATLAQWLAPRLGETVSTLYERLARTGADGEPKKFVWLKRRMTEEESARLGDLRQAPDAEALALQDEPIRSYPEGPLAAHVLGFANREGVGSEGIEARYDSYLRSNPGRRVSRTDRQRNMMGFRTLEFEPPSGGDDVYLTLDSAIQFRLEQELDRAIKDNNAKRAMGILMDPKTGAVLALATRPAFDPNEYMNVDPALRRNGAVIDMFEPGSSFKIVTAAAALESGLISPGDPIDCMGGRFNPYGHTIRDTHALGVVPFSRCFAVSSNIAMIKVAALLGPERLESWIHRFGFGEATTLGVPGEEKGMLASRARWSRLTMGSLPMGQEVAVTLTQLARAFSVIANGGLRVEPYLVDEVRSAEGALRWKRPTVTPERVLSEQTAATMRDLCYGVVASKEATGHAAAIPEYRVGGKTGTAQIAMPGGGGYYPDRYTAIFAGFAPVSNPRITCVIVVQEPMQRSHFGGFVAGPVFAKVVGEALVRLHVPLDPDPSALRKGGAPMDETANRLELALLEPSEANARLDGLELLKSGKDDIFTGPRLPSFIGLTKREAKELAVSLGIAWDPQGAGRVVSQDPPAGTRLDEVRQCTLVFTTGLNDELKL
jgi:cell division protein FtsI/penicillin-binding protein 2